MSANLSIEPERAKNRGGGLYFGAALVSQASGLLRYIVLARLLGPHELGLAAALMVTGSFFEMVTDTGSDRFLIQDRDGDLPAVQHLVQLVYVARGLVVSGALAAASVPIAMLYGTPRLAGGLMLLAMSPLIGGLMHLDMRRLQRDHDFRREAICMGAADAAGLAGAVVAALLLRSYIAAGIGFIVRTMTLVMLSHALADRRYAISYDRSHAPRLARFAAPLLLNGLTLFLVLQGDRVVIGNQLGVTTLGYYSAILLPIAYPAAVIGNTIHGLFLPRIAGCRDDTPARDREIDFFGSVTVFLGLGMATAYVVVAPLAVPLLYGQRFAQPASLIGLVALVQATRFLLGWPSTTALALGRSLTVLLANLCHLAIVPGALLGLWIFGGLSGAVGGFLCAEIGALIVALLLLNWGLVRKWSTGFFALGLLLLTGLAVEAFGVAWDRKSLMVALATLPGVGLVIACNAKRGRAVLEMLASIFWRQLK